jgi:hypothetical protein
MPILANSHGLRRPVEHRVTVLETPEDRAYLGHMYNSYPNPDGTFSRFAATGYEIERLPFLGLHLVEELDSDGAPNGNHKLLTPEELKEQFHELGAPDLEYGFRALGGANIFFHPLQADIATARSGVDELQLRHPLGKFEVISRPAGSNDDWTVVGL